MTHLKPERMRSSEDVIKENMSWKQSSIQNMVEINWSDAEKRKYLYNKIITREKN